MLPKVIIIVTEFIFPCLVSRVKRSLSRAQNIFMSKNLNSVVIYIYVSCEQFYSGLHSAGQSYSTYFYSYEMNPGFKPFISCVYILHVHAKKENTRFTLIKYNLLSYRTAGDPKLYSIRFPDFKKLQGKQKCESTGNETILDMVKRKFQKVGFRSCKPKFENMLFFDENDNCLNVGLPAGVLSTAKTYKCLFKKELVFCQATFVAIMLLKSTMRTGNSKVSLCHLRRLTLSSVVSQKSSMARCKWISAMVKQCLKPYQGIIDLTRKSCDAVYLHVDMKMVD